MWHRPAATLALSRLISAPPWTLVRIGNLIELTQVFPPLNVRAVEHP
jgi:hypothetical protein